MLEKFRLQKHRLYFYIVPIFLIKFLLVRYFLFENIHLLQTVWVEIFYLLFIFILIEFIPNDRVKGWIYITLNFIFTILLIGLVIYFRYSSQVVSILMLSQLKQVGTVKSSVFKLTNPLYFLLALDLIIFFVWRWRAKFKFANVLHKKNTVFLCIILFVSLAMCTKDVLANKNELITNASYTAENEGIFTFEIVSVIQHFSKPPELALSDAKLQQEINKLKRSVESTDKKFNRVLEGKNIIFIQLEAFQDILINLKVEGKEVTPFLNKLSNESLYFPNIYQQISMGSTSDAEFLANTSLYPSINEATTKEFGDRIIPSFPRLLQKEGYYTMTMHANEVSFWNRENLYPALGFEKWYDVEYFSEDDVVGIGQSDKAFFQKASNLLKQYNSTNQPFYAQLITLTSHHPFDLPDELNTLELSEQYDDTLVGDYFKVAHYVDKQLEMFFKDLESNGVLQNSVVILYGDHQGLQVNALKDEEKELLNNVLGHEYTFMDQFNIPFFIHAENENLIKTVETVGGQIDIMPTVANLIGLSLVNHPHFGQDLLNNKNNLFGMRYYMPYGSFFYNNIVYKTETNYEDGTAYNLITHQPLSHSTNLSTEYERIMKLLQLNDQYLNSLPLRDDTEH